MHLFCPPACGLTCPSARPPPLVQYLGDVPLGPGEETSAEYTIFFPRQLPPRDFILKASRAAPAPALPGQAEGWGARQGAGGPGACCARAGHPKALPTCLSLRAQHGAPLTAPPPPFLQVSLFYSSNGAFLQREFFNETITIIEEPTWLDTQLIGLYIIGLAVLAGIREWRSGGRRRRGWGGGGGWVTGLI